MVTSLLCGMSPEMRLALCSLPLNRSSLREVALLLPEDDGELLQWVEEAFQREEPNELILLLYAAANAGRKLPATLLSEYGLGLFRDGWRFGWVAARMEGDLMAALLQTSGDDTTPQVSALAMFVAARWWCQHRPGEAFPVKLQASARNFRHHMGISPDIEGAMGATALLMKDPSLTSIWGGEGWASDRAREENLKRIEAYLEAPLEEALPEKVNNGYAGSQPMRRAVPHYGRNERCHCGSGKKYKKCCERKDQDRLRRSSSVAGKTWDELEEDIEAITPDAVREMTLPELAKLHIPGMIEESQELALFRLAMGEYFEEVVSAFQELELPDRLQAAWRAAILSATRAWQRDVVMQLLVAAREQAPPLEQLKFSTRLLLASQDPADFCATVERESLALLKSHDSKGLEDLVAGLTWSPYAALGIMVARGALLLTGPEESSWIFHQILEKRAFLDLPIDDPASDLLDERASRRRAGDDNAVLAEAQANLEAKVAEVRQVREKLAALEREIGLREKREKRAATEQASAATAEPAELKAMREKVITMKSLLKEWGQERGDMRRQLEKLHAEMTALQAAKAPSAPPEEDHDEEPGEALVVHGQQPVRLIAFPKKFRERLGSFPSQVGRAVMALAGRIASGEAAAFEGLVKIRACDGVVRARVAGDYRLLLHLTPEELQILDVVNRRDLDRRAQALGAQGA